MFNSLRKKLRRVQVLKKFYSKILNCLHCIIFPFKLVRINILHFKGQNFDFDENSDVIVCLTSYPARINKVWITIESLGAQSYKPRKLILVLSRLDFPDEVLPIRIRRQEGRGLCILWTEDNLKSYKKLIPAVQFYPNSSIITFDDDVIYESWRVARLVGHSKKNPSCIIGYRGKKIERDGKGLAPYDTWRNINGVCQSNDIILTGVGGIMYPPNSLSYEILFDVDLANSLAPSADDLWFWLTARLKGTRTICLGVNNHFPIEYESKDSLSNKNVLEGENDIQLIRIFDAFPNVKID